MLTIKTQTKNGILQLDEQRDYFYYKIKPKNRFHIFFNYSNTCDAATIYKSNPKYLTTRKSRKRLTQAFGKKKAVGTTVMIKTLTAW